MKIIRIQNPKSQKNVFNIKELCKRKRRVNIRSSMIDFKILSYRRYARQIANEKQKQKIAAQHSFAL